MSFPSRLRAFTGNLKKAHPKFEDRLNIFFDSIGFTEDFPPVFQKNALLRSHAVKDNVWGMIEFDESIRRLIDSPLVQRLRGIRQNGLTHLTYPSATHTRFAHTLGVYYSAMRLISEIEKTCDLSSERTDAAPLHATKPNRNTIELLKRAAILHDVGHGPFSHVSEALFSPGDNDLSLGGVPLNELLRQFRLDYFDIRHPNGSARPSGGKKLSEIISCLFICSNRFQTFYRSVVDQINLNDEPDVYNISTLILGDRIVEDDLATPAILSSAIDADKIDYMIRDAAACGISLSIDPSRTFQGAGIYSLPVRDDPYFGEKNLTNTNNVSVFVIDKSGSDTYFQVGVSRLSLYSRVYHHPLTRNAEFKFNDLLKNMQANDHSLKDILRIWSMSEGEIFHAAQNSSDTQIRHEARDFIWRHLPKRAANLELAALTFCTLGPHTSKFETSFATLVTDFLYPTFEEIQFVEGISKRMRDIGKVIESPIPKHHAINLRFIPPPGSDEAIIGNTRLIDRASQRLVKCEFHVPSYLQAGALSERRSYIVADEGLREIAAVATALEILNRGRDREAFKPTITDENKTSNEFLPRQIGFLPILDMSKVSNTCKISQKKISEILMSLEQKTPTDPALRLLNRPYPSTQTLALVDKFSSFQGAKGWHINQSHFLNFIAQFPSHLRPDVLRLLEHFHIFNREKICTDIQKAIDQAKIEKSAGRAFVVPFTMNSGHLTLSFMRDSVRFPDDTWTLKDSLRAALADIRKGDWIVFVDDHAASGTQVHRRLSQWVKGGMYEGGDTKLEHNYLNAFKESNIAFAFAAMADQGKDVIKRISSELDLKIKAIACGVSFKEFSLRNVLADMADLKEFLMLVGTGLMLPRFASLGFKRRVAAAKNFSLGYQNAEGGLVTELNVPTSTYTAFWRPGFYDPTGRYRTCAASHFPWMPLFIRSSHIDQVCLF
jgi:deoxynucleoside triphosphate triphosphohydrolase SAMHD1